MSWINSKVSVIYQEIREQKWIAYILKELHKFMEILMVSKYLHKTAEQTERIICKIKENIHTGQLA